MKSKDKMKDKKKIVFLGPPYAGKGTIASKVSIKFEIPHISTGELFREAITNKTPVGLEAKKFIDKGMLVPDEVTIKLVQERLSSPDCKKGYIFDGFPRTIPQADALDAVEKVNTVILFEAPDSVLAQRVTGRLSCRKCGAIFHKTNLPPKKTGICDKCGGELYTRDDDKPDAVKKRLAVYKEQTEPLIDYYEKKGILKHINANRNVDEILKDTINAIYF
jgi:adenylate kinase